MVESFSKSLKVIILNVKVIIQETGENKRAFLLQSAAAEVFKNFSFNQITF